MGGAVAAVHRGWASRGARSRGALRPAIFVLPPHKVTHPGPAREPSPPAPTPTGQLPPHMDTASGPANQTFDFDGDYGEGYEALARQVIPGYRTLFPMFTAIIEPDLPPGGRVFVVGAGTGIEIIALKRARPDLRLHGVDPSEQMLRIAERRVAEAGVSSGVSLQLGYAADVPRRPRFDAATLINVLHFVPDDGAKAALLNHIAHRLRPGAVFVLFDLHGDPGSEEHERYMPAWQRYWKIRGMTSEEEAAFGERIRRGIHFAPAERVLALAADAGFGDPQRFFKGMLYGGWTFRRAGG